MTTFAGDALSLQTLSEDVCKSRDLISLCFFEAVQLK